MKALGVVCGVVGVLFIAMMVIGAHGQDPNSIEATCKRLVNNRAGYTDYDWCVTELKLKQAGNRIDAQVRRATN
jgi:hypothetical protein